MIRILALLLASAAIAVPAGTAQQAAAQAVRSLSESDRAQGAAAHPELLKQYGGAYGGPQAGFVRRVGQRVAVESGLSNKGSDFTVTLLDSPVENAFAIPGGYIYITRQLLALMTSEAELASVLGHEVGHVAARHSASRNKRATVGSILAAGAGILTGSTLASRAVGAGAQLYTLGYGRDQEYQADALGIRYMTAAGYDPYAAADILAALDASTSLAAQASGRNAQSVPTWASTHPNSRDRVQRAARLAGETNWPDAPPPQDVAFLRMLDGLPYGAANSKKVIRVVTVGAKDTVESLSARMAFPDLQRDRFELLNGLTQESSLRAGMLVKLVVSAGG
jgi:predicted Zn-dependent protease